MSIIIWNNSFSVGIPKVDKQHQQLFYLLNEFYDNCVSNAPSGELTILFEELLDYAKYHLAEEEGWMEKCSFAGLEMHKKEHEKFSIRVVELDKKYRVGNKHILLETAAFISEWIKTHILELDAEYGRFMKSNYIDIE